MSIFVEFVCEALSERKVITSAAFEYTEKFKFEYLLPESISSPDKNKSPFLLPQDWLLTHGLSNSVENESYSVRYSAQITVNFTKKQLMKAEKVDAVVPITVLRSWQQRESKPPRVRMNESPCKEMSKFSCSEIYIEVPNLGKN